MGIVDQLQQAKAIIRAVQEHLHQLVDDVLQQPIPGVRSITEDPNCIVVSLGSLRATGNLCLDPRMYDAREQRKEILRMIDNEEPMYALDTLRELCSTGRSSSRYFRDIRIHPDVIRRLDVIMKKAV